MQGARIWLPNIEGFFFFPLGRLLESAKKIQLLENKANSPKVNLLFALLFSSNKGLYA